MEQRKSLTKFRISSHQLMIEKGRHYGIPREERLCPHGDLNEVEDEIHFIFSCSNNTIPRKSLYTIISIMSSF
jgi:hypothetical protein